MKQLLLLFLLAISYSLSAQTPDYQWFVKNGKFLNKNTALYIAPTAGPNNAVLPIYIEGVNHPNPEFGTPLITPRNDFFIIYDDLSLKHFNSFADVGNASDLDGENDSNAPDVNYQFNPPSGKTIEYMYFTNVYDGDDDPDAIVSNNQPSEFTQVNLPLSSPSPSALPTFVSPDPFSFNHTIVKGRDVTIILNKAAIPDSIESCEKFNFCWEVPPGINFDLERSAVFGADTNLDYRLGLTGNHSLSGNCIRNISLNQFQGDFAYLNLRAPDTIPFALIGQAMTFTLGCKGNSWSDSILIDKAHDPNLIDALCIREIGDRYYVQYEFICTNEMQGDPMVKLSIDLPPAAKSLSIYCCNINDISIDVDDIVCTPANLINLASSTLQFEFPKVLKDYRLNDWENSSIVMKFCIEYDEVLQNILDSQNYDPNFTQINGNTTFTSAANGSVDYPIMNHFNLCEEHEIYYENGYPQVTGSMPWCKSDSIGIKGNVYSSYCDCNCGPSTRLERFRCKVTSWARPVILGLVLLFGVVAYLLLRKNRS